MKRSVFLSILVTITSLLPVQAQGPAQPPDDLTLAVPPPISEGLSGWWGQADFLLWRVRQGPLAGPLVTTGSPADALPGALGQPGTRLLYAGNQDYGTFAGIRFGVGYRPGPDTILGLEASGFALETRRVGAIYGSDLFGFPVLAQPVIAPAAGETSFLTALPGMLAGQIAVSTSSELHGWDLNANLPMTRDSNWRAEALAGFRSLRLSEDLAVSSDTIPIAPGMIGFLGMPVPPGTLLSARDLFRATNDFYGGQLGGRVGVMAETLGVELLGKVALGVNQQVLTVQGSSVAAIPGLPPAAAPGGVLAVDSNIGRYYRSVFAVVPEIGVNGVWDPTPWIRVRLGYTFLWISQVARPGNQIDRTIDPARIPTDGAFGAPTSPRPTVFFRESEFWAQGVNLGVEFRY